MMNTNYKPKFMYDQPMFMVTVSTVVIDENGILMVMDELRTEEIQYGFPGGSVKAGQETVQFAAIRHIKEQLGITIKKDSLIPIDFRSDPDRSESGNVIDIGFVTVLENKYNSKGKWIEVDFEQKNSILDDRCVISSDNEVLLRRALEVVLMIKE